MGIFSRRKPALVNAALAAFATQLAIGESAISRQYYDNEDVLDGQREQTGALASATETRLQWYEKTISLAVQNADVGNLELAAQLWRAARTDGVLAGPLALRTQGVVRLPRQWYGDPELISLLREGEASIRSVFDELCPPAELAALDADGIGLGVGIGEMVPVTGRDFPILVRHEPEGLTYHVQGDFWTARIANVETRIDLSTGRWVLHLPGGRVNPWRQAIWQAAGKAFIRKEHADLYSKSWQSKLAHPARVAICPPGSSEKQQLGFFRRLLAWGVNTVFSLPAGWDIKLIESNGRGYESFDRAIERSDRDTIFAVSGQTVTAEGGKGFINGDLFSAIRLDLIQGDADALAYTINTQILPRWSYHLTGGFDRLVALKFDARPPGDLKALADSHAAFASAVRDVNSTVAAYGKRVKLDEYAVRHGVILEDLPSLAGGVST